MAQFLYFDCDGRRRRMHKLFACAQGILALVGSKGTSESSTYGLIGVITRQYPY
jgi:hypothetical protein